MELWQMDIVGGVRLVGGGEAKIVSGIDDQSRYAVCARVVAGAMARLVCDAFEAAMDEHGVPEKVLTDNGKVFTARFGPGPGPVLFDRICRDNGITHMLTAPRSHDDDREDRAVAQDAASRVRRREGVRSNRRRASAARCVGRLLQP
jgi:transposase InsO family protein